MKWNELQNESCPVARGLSVVGDRWTMLVLRDCFLGIRRFEQMQDRLGITRHVLADRLRKLEGAGVLRREAYQERPLRHEYRLTERGKALYPMLVSLIDWANAHVPIEGSPVGHAGLAQCGHANRAHAGRSRHRRGDYPPQCQCYLERRCQKSIAAFRRPPGKKLRNLPAQDRLTGRGRCINCLPWLLSAPYLSG